MRKVFELHFKEQPFLELIKFCNVPKWSWSFYDSNLIHSVEASIKQAFFGKVRPDRANHDSLEHIADTEADQRETRQVFVLELHPRVHEIRFPEGIRGVYAQSRRQLQTKNEEWEAWKSVVGHDHLIF